MCGICGKLDLNGRPVDGTLVRAMAEAMAHRGPDDEGVYLSGPVGLGHKRLKIIDLTMGRQPLANEDETVWVVFNGEIYNYRELRSDLRLKGHQFKTNTDTEVIVHLYEEMGERCVQQMRGMFSFAVWDDRRRRLLLARDRVGIKPLYYRLSSDSLLFASEIKAILADPSVQADIDPLLLDRFLTFFYTPGAPTLFKTIQKLEPGHYLIAENGRIRVERYWDLTFTKRRRPFGEAVDELKHLLAQTVRDHMISDVPVGVLLSGGVDSSGVLGYAVEQTPHPISTFTVGFDGGCTDERPYARMAAEAFGVRNYDITVSARDFLEFLPRYVWHMEEPVCEPPAIALYYVSKFAREHVTVLLSGEGGDEAFGGYPSYRNFHWLETIKRRLGPLSRPAGALVAELGRADRFARLAKYGPLMTTPLEAYYYSHSSGPYEFFNSRAADLYTPDFLSAINGHRAAEASRQMFNTTGNLAPLDRMLYVDTKTWLPDDLLIKADKMTMANSLELRVPLLDHQILEFAASLPVEYKLRGWTTKHILKKALESRVPQAILSRKKTGFPVPYAGWLTGELRDDISAILLDKRSLDRGYFRRDAIEKLVRRRDNGHNYSKELFSLVTLELWHRIFLEHCDAASLLPV